MTNRDSKEAVVIGASAGALDALMVILPKLPAGYPAPVVVVVHIPPDRDSILPELLGRMCALPCVEAEDKERIEPGRIYFAPPDYHVLLEANGLLSLSSDEPVLFSRPSVDVLFESAADVYGSGLTAVVLTGANDDGARGAQAVSGNGGMVIVQRPDTAQCPAMPTAALKLCPHALSLTLEDIAAYLAEIGRT